MPPLGNLSVSSILPEGQQCAMRLACFFFFFCLYYEAFHPKNYCTMSRLFFGMKMYRHNSSLEQSLNPVRCSHHSSGYLWSLPVLSSHARSVGLFSSRSTWNCQSSSQSASSQSSFPWQCVAHPQPPPHSQSIKQTYFLVLIGPWMKLYITLV